MPRKKYIYYTSAPQTFLYILMTSAQYIIFVLYTLKLYRDMVSNTLTIMLGFYLYFCYQKYYTLAKDQSLAVTSRDLARLETQNKDLREFYDDLTCQMCKIKIPPRVYHCDSCMKCYDQPLKHSFMLGKCISKKIHVSYLKMLIHHFLLLKFSGLNLLYLYFVQFQNLLIQRGFSGIANINDIMYTLRRVKSQNWGFQYFFFYLLIFGVLLFIQIIIVWKKVTLPFQEREMNYLKYKFYMRKQVIGETIYYLKEQDITYKDKNDIRDIIIDGKLCVKKFHNLYSRKSVFSIFRNN